MLHIYQPVDFINVKFLECANTPTLRRYIGKFIKDQVSHLQLTLRWFSKQKSTEANICMYT